MAKKRTKIEIIRDILEVLKKNKQVKITHIIYKSNLTNNSVKPILENLLENKLVQKITEKEKTFFSITKKGEEFLDEFSKMKVFSEAYGI